MRHLSYSATKYKLGK